ncbi:caspase family protein [Mesorhizobium sp. VK25A]|uniref:Caspase family protein n=1 Tax=Mesorhizobium vachelliae TaxID=3072309 RepID=A0ABU5A043_9HYPH|nr:MULTISPECIES: caspase family protein [unclassified Mesorhizobium]MDX8531048.1 caspase family protein [Mesorhizobium sp. VK25D]MDX8543201.1 caspase family protein [Mesorhizobium sp. VK25A]
MRTLQKFLGLVVVLVIFAVGSAAGALAQGEKRLAFVIGNGAYQSGELATAANDGGLIAQTLQAAGFDVVGARDVDQESLRGALRDFLGKVSAAGPDAVVFVYLAGRGVQFEGENYFLPVDAQIANPADVPLQAMRLSDVTKSLAGLPAKVNIVVLDAARPNAFPKMSQPLAGGLALVDPDPNMLIAFNAAPGTVAPEGKGPYGAYAQALAEMIREGGLSLDDVFDRTRLRVNEVTQGAEVPWNASKIEQPFVFFERAPDAPAPKVSEAESRSNRTKEIRDFDAHDAYVAALDRDTMRGYQDFLVAYPHDPMAKRVRAIIAARREAITWRETWLRDTPEAYWSYLQRYPHGPHAWDARRRLEHFDAALEPPEEFTVYDYDLPPPPEEEIIYVDRPVLYFDDPDFDFEPPPPVAVIFLPPPPPDFVVLEAPPPPVDVFVLPTPVFVAIPDFINPPRDIVPPRDNIIFNNIHNTTVINNINNTTINESNQAAQGNGGGLTTGQKMTGAAVGLGAAALATKVALPPLLQKRAALLKQNPAAQGKLGQGAAQGQQPGGAAPLSKAQGKLSTEHALPGTNGKTLPLVNGKPPVLNGQNLPIDKTKKLPNNQGVLGGNQQSTGNAGAAADQGKNGKLHKLPTVNGAPAQQDLNAQQKLHNNPNALSGQNNGKPKRLTRKDLSAGQPIVVPNGQGSPNGDKKLRRLQNDGGQQNKVNKPNVQVLSKPQKPEFHAQPKPQVQERRVLQQPKPQVQERRVLQQPKPQVQERRIPQQPKPQMQERRPVQQPRPEQPQANKKPSCGRPGEPPCKQ